MNAATFVDLLARRAEKDGAARVFSFLDRGEGDGTPIDFAELDRRARGVAVRLAEAVPPRARALLLCAPGLDFVAGLFGCLYAGVVAVPTFPPDPGRLQRTLPRALAVLADTGAEAIVSTREIAALAPFLAAQAPELASMRWVMIDGPYEADGWRRPEILPHSLAVLQYTSGSSGTPKGVMLTHENLLDNSALIRQSFGLGPDSLGVIWLPPYHDMGLVGGILQSVFTSFPTVLMSPMAFLERPMRWLEAISQHRGTCSGGPNFAFDLCVRRASAEDHERLDLSSWRVAFCGAEPVRADTLDRFATAFAPSGFRRRAFFPCYGLGEATLMVTGGAIDDEPVVAHFDRAALATGVAVEVGPPAAAADGARAEASPVTLVGCGRELPGHVVEVVDQSAGEVCEDGRVGEVWVTGPSVGRGYWRQPGESQRTFRARLAGSAERTYLRTGDLGFMRGGQLFLAGRAKDVIIIHGASYWPQDIETAVERCHPAIRPGCGAAFSIDDDSGEQLAVVFEIERRHRMDRRAASRGPNTVERRRQDPPGPPARPPTQPPDGPALDMDEVLMRIRAAVAEEFGLPLRLIALLRAGTIPKTSSGKIQRRACRRLLVEGSLTVIQEWQSGTSRAIAAPRLPEEEQLARIFCEALGLERVGVHDGFFDLGGQSVHGAAVVARVRQVFRVELPMRALFETPTVAELAVTIAKLQATALVRP